LNKWVGNVHKGKEGGGRTIRKNAVVAAAGGSESQKGESNQKNGVTRADDSRIETGAVRV